MKRFFSVYTIPLALSATVAIAILALSVVRAPVQIALTIFGAIFGAIALDMEYIIYAYLIEPDTEFSQNIKAFLKHKDLNSAIDYIQTHKDDIKDKSLNSALFQIVLSMVCIFVVYASTMPFVKALVLSIFANSIYKLIEHYFSNTTDEWFWSYKVKPEKSSVIAYIAVFMAILVFCFFII